MLLDETGDDLAADFAILETIGEHIDGLIENLMDRGAIHKTLRRWLVGHADLPEDEDARTCLAAMAADLEMFTPSVSGRTMIDRHLRAQVPETPDERQAFQAMSAAQFRLVRIVDREGPDLVRLKDLVTGESLALLNEQIAPMAAGVTTAMRLCPLDSGRQVLISPLFAMDETMLGEAMAFVRNGRLLGDGHRCAASLYRNVARRGFRPLPQLIDDLDEDEIADLLREVVEHLSPVERLALDWISGGDADPDLVVQARSLASVENLIDVLGSFAQIEGDEAAEGLREAYEQIAALQVETIAQRARAGLGGAAEMLGHVATEIADHIAHGRMNPGAAELLARLRQRSAYAGAKHPGAEASSSAS